MLPSRKIAKESLCRAQSPLLGFQKHHHLARAAGGQRGRKYVLMSCKLSQIRAGFLDHKNRVQSTDLSTTLD